MPSKKIEFERKSLRKWIELEEARSKIKDIFKSKDATKVSQAIFEYLQSAIKGSDVGEWAKLDTNTLLAFYIEAASINSPTRNFPILKFYVESKEKLPWEYDGRAWYFWLNLFSKNYDWTIEYISNLDIDDAIGLYQELEIDRQLEREWQWGLSELAYSYDKTSKSSRFNPLPRPTWMLPIAPRPKTIRIPKDMLPIGIIDNQDELSKAVDAQRNA